MKSLGNWGSWILALLVLLSAVALADDPPGRVARLQYMSGQVSLQPGGVNDWVEAVLNRPLTTADRLWTDKESRAELDLGSAALRAGSETSVTLTNVNDNTVQVELDQGSMDVRVRRLYGDEIYEVDTPNLAFTIMKAGEYRFDVDPNGDSTVVTVWHGAGEATGEGRSVRVKGDHRAIFSNGTSLEHQVSDDPERDGFDDWCRVRNRREDYSQSARYVSPDVIGAEDLDEYGTWHVVPTYGAVWTPAVAPGWAPYHYGHWAWVEPWGWTWVDDAPWGFAPCHYGRWIYYGGAWAWVPGPPAVRPVYAPALVAWVGGGGSGVTIAVGEAPTVGWFPLGYGEPYVPPYEGSRNYFQQVNVSNTRITNITNVTNNYYTTNVNNTNITRNNTTIVNNNTTNITTNNSINVNGNHNNVHIRYANEKVPGAVTAVPGTVLANSQPVAQAAVRIPPGQLKAVRVAAAPPVAPSRNSVLGVRAGAPAPVPPARVVTRQVVMKTPAPPRPVPFSMKQEALASHPGRPLDRDTEQQLRTRIARQSVNRPGNMAEKQNFNSNGIAKPAVGVPARGAESQQPAPGAAFHPVPRPPARSEVQPPGPSAERAVQRPASQPGFQPFGSPRNEHVPQPAANGPAAERGASRPEPGMTQPHHFGDQPNANSGQQHAVPRPPERGNTPGFQSFGSPRPQSNSVPQPPSNGAAVDRGTKRPQPEVAQPRNFGAPQNSPGNQSQPDRRPGSVVPRPAPASNQGSGHANTESPRVERPVARPEPARSSRNEARQPSSKSNAAPEHKQSNDNSRSDKQH